MRRPSQRRPHTGARPGSTLRRFRLASQDILHDAHRGLLRTEFLSSLAKTFLGSCQCDSVEVRVTERGKEYRCEFVRGSRQPAHFEVLPGVYSEHSASDAATHLDHLCHLVSGGRLDASPPHSTKHGSFWTNDAKNPVSIVCGPGEDVAVLRVEPEVTRPLSLIWQTRRPQSPAAEAFLAFTRDRVTELGLLVQNGAEPDDGRAL